MQKTWKEELSAVSCALSLALRTQLSIAAANSKHEMEPASLALGVVAVFKDTYLTAKFIRNTVQSIKGYQAEQSQLVMHYTVQIYRLKNLSRLFRNADGNTVDMKLLETVPEVCRRSLIIDPMAQC